MTILTPRQEKVLNSTCRDIMKTLRDEIDKQARILRSRRYLGNMSLAEIKREIKRMLCYKYDVCL